MRRLLLVAVVVALLGGIPATAHARSGKKAIWGPVSVDGVSQFALYHDLGTRFYQYALPWANIAPTRPANPRNPQDPAYEWPAELADAIAEAKRYRMRVLIQVIGAPRWANGGHAWNWPPRREKDYQDFLAATAKKYPSVHLWMVWGEPSRKPNWASIVKAKPFRKLTRRQAAAPRRYARLLDASYATLKRQSKRNLVIGGNTFTTGDISTYQWVRNMRLPNGKTPRMDLYGHNPFGFREPNLSNPSSTVQAIDFSDLKRLARLLDQNFRRGSKKKLPLFLSEWNIPTQKSTMFNFWVDEPVQARWIRSGLRIVRRWSRIYALGWISVRDEPPQLFGGLLRSDGSRKPGYAAFRDG